MEGRARRRRAKAPFTTDPGIRDGLFPQARKVTPAAHQGAHGGGGASEGKCRPEAILLAGVRASPSAAVTGGERTRSESRRWQLCQEEPVEELTGISGDKRKDWQRSLTRDCRGWASPFRTDGRRKAGGPSGGSGGRVGPGSTCETDGTKKFQRAKEPSVGQQRWRCDPARRSSGTKWGKEGRGESNVEGYVSVARVLDSPASEYAACFVAGPSTHDGITRKN